MTVWEATVNHLIGSDANHQLCNRSKEYTNEENLYQEARGSYLCDGNPEDRGSETCPF